MTANPSKFRPLVVGKNDSNINQFQINNEPKINVGNEVALLRIHIDKRCKKATMHLNAIKRLARFMGSKEREAIVNSFILCNFNYCPLI